MRRFLHWLLCHTVVITLLVFLLIAIVFRGPIFGIEPDPEIITESDTTEAQPAAQADTAVAGSEQPNADADDEQMPVALQQILHREAAQPPPELVVPETEQAETAGASEVEAVQPEVESSVETATSDVVEPPESPEPSQAQAAPADADESISVTVNETEPEIAQPSEPLQNEMAAAIPDTGFAREGEFQFRDPLQDSSAEISSPAAEELLQQARRAYWNDDLQTAKSLYQDYIRQHPNSPDGYGELGNLLSTQGELSSAADMYRQAADLLMQQGKQEQAEQLRQVLSSIEVIQNSPQ
ncbi:MAG: hypothetical protein PVG66_04680 [Chromatiales bacterium]|jgi:tetratricopeptide (TPR) repeat protein